MKFKHLCCATVSGTSDSKFMKGISYCAIVWLLHVISLISNILLWCIVISVFSQFSLFMIYLSVCVKPGISCWEIKILQKLNNCWLLLVPIYSSESNLRVLKLSMETGSYNRYINPSCASPPELCELAYPRETNGSFFKHAFPTMADYCFT